MRDATAVHLQEAARGCVIMRCMSAETRAELIAASRAYERETRRSEARTAAVRERLYAAIIAEKREGTLVSEITDIAPYRRGHVTRILDEAGLVKKKDAPDS